MKERSEIWDRETEKGEKERIIIMGSRGVLTKNYFIYPETVAEYGAEIERVMTETDRAMEEASEIIAKMASVTERIPSQIRSGELLELCEMAQAEIRSFDFLSYGKRVNQGLLNLLDQNQYITENFIKKMEATTERMREFGAGCRRLTELIDYSGGSLPLKGLALSAVSTAEDESTDGEEENLIDRGGKEKIKDIRNGFLFFQYKRYKARRLTAITLCDPVVAYSGYPQEAGFEHMIQMGDVNNPYNVSYTDDSQVIQGTNQTTNQTTNQQTICHAVDVTELNTISNRGWYSYLGHDMDETKNYYDKVGLSYEELDNGFRVQSGDQECTFYLLDDKWWVDENGRYVITVGPGVLDVDYNGGSQEFDDFREYFGRQIDVVLVNDNEPDDVLTLECVYGGDIKLHTYDNWVYMTGRIPPDGLQTDTPDGSSVEFWGIGNLKDENDPNCNERDNGFMRDYHVELIIVHDNEEEEN